MNDAECDVIACFVFTHQRSKTIKTNHFSSIDCSDYILWFHSCKVRRLIFDNAS